MDILEFFINKVKVYLIFLMDDFPRFIIGWHMLGQTSVDAVIVVVSDAVDRHKKMGRAIQLLAISLGDRQLSGTGRAVPRAGKKGPLRHGRRGRHNRQKLL